MERMMTASLSVRIAPLSAQKYASQRGHDLRTGRVPGYVDRTRSNHNSKIIEAPTIDDLKAHVAGVKARSSCRQKKLPKNLAYSGILTFSYEAQDIAADLTDDEIDRRVKASIDAIAIAHNVDVLSITVHRDEAALHAHFTLCAVDRSGHALQLKPRDTSALQDIAAGPWSDLGITRGKKKTERIKNNELFSATVHRSVRKLHEDLPKELASLEQQRAEAAGRLRKIESILAKEMSYYRSISTQQQRDEELVHLRAEKNELLNTLETLKEREKKLSAVARSFVKKLNPTARPVVEKNLVRLGLADVIPPLAAERRRISPAQTR
jgi:flagellum-specific peptidoglycan hydrolase FlgJ